VSRRALVVLAMLLGASPAAAQLQLSRIEGLVVDGDGKPVAGAVVALTDPLGAEIAASTVDRSGRFHFPDISPGRYALRATTPGNAPQHLPLRVDGALPIEVTIRVPARVTDTVVVEASLGGDPAASRAGLAGDSVGRVPTRQRGGALQDLVATLPGWSAEDNGLLHARGVDDGFLYVIDGIPVYERLDVLSGIAPDLSTVASVNVMTGYVPPQYGYKAGGVIEIRSGGGGRRWTGSADIGGGSDAAIDGGLTVGGGLGDRASVRVGVLAQRSDRFLDPVHPDNLHNRGRASSTSGQVEWSVTSRDHITAGWGLGTSHFDVPHTGEQEEAGQDQRQRIAAGYATLSWQATWSPAVVTQAALYHRDTAVTLEGSAFDTPLSADARRTLVRTGMLAGVMHQRGAHLIKAGFEGQRLALDERFGFVITDPDEAREAGFQEEALVFGPDRPFAVTGRATPAVWSAYVQDSWQARPGLTLSGGVRFDRSRLLLARHQWSPRLGLSQRINERTILRAALSRFFQPPQPENLLLSSSAEARALSPFAVEGHEGGADVEPERQWSFETGIEHRWPRGVRLDATYWRRRITEVADPNVFFGTTLIFPNAVAKGRAHGFDVRVEVPPHRGWSGYANWSMAHVRQTGPITGGLFLEDEAADIGPGTEFVPDHDQRLVAAAGLTWEDAQSRLAVSLTGRYETGAPMQREDDEVDDLAARPGADRVDFESGRVKPRTIVSVQVSAPVLQTDRVLVRVRAQALNLLNDRYAYNFGNPFSGTHFGAPRSGSVSVTMTFR
jgi:outer membrane receptor for ferrienterochelin and colicin